MILSFIFKNKQKIEKKKSLGDKKTNKPHSGPQLKTMQEIIF